MTNACVNPEINLSWPVQHGDADMNNEGGFISLLLQAGRSWCRGLLLLLQQASGSLIDDILHLRRLTA